MIQLNNAEQLWAINKEAMMEQQEEEFNKNQPTKVASIKQEEFWKYLSQTDCWVELAKFRSWIDARRWCEERAGAEKECEWRMVIPAREGWFIVERYMPGEGLCK